MVCDKGYIWNPSNCACESDQSCGIGQYLDYKNCVFRNSLVDKLVEECTNVIDGDTIYNKTLTVTSSNDCSLCTPYIVLFTIFLSISVIISGAFIYFHWYKNKQLNLKNDVPSINYSKNEMVTTKQLNIKNRIYYLYDDLINLKDFDPNLPKLDKKSSMDISIYYIGYVTNKAEYNIDSVNPVYLLISDLDGFIEEKEDSKYLNISLKFNNNMY